MKVILFVEGDTEQKILPGFLKKWLDPKLEKPIKIHCDNIGQKFCTKSRAADIVKRIKNYSKSGDAKEIVAFIGLMDLYGLDNNNWYPTKKTTVQDRVAWAREKIEGEVNNPKFKMHFAVHELEAWLLSEPKIFPEAVKDALVANRKVERPESVNFDKPPAKLLKELYRTKLPNKQYKKIVNGVDLFRELDPAAACEKCPHLKELLDDILSFAETSAPSPQS